MSVIISYPDQLADLVVLVDDAVYTEITDGIIKEGWGISINCCSIYPEKTDCAGFEKKGCRPINY